VRSTYNKITKDECLEKFDNTKFDKVRFRNEGAFLVVWDFHHKDVRLMSNLKKFLEAIFRSFMQLEACKM